MCLSLGSKNDVCLCVCLGKDGAVSQSDVQVNGVQVEELAALRVELEELRTQHTLLQTQLTEKDTLLTSMVCISVCVCVCLIIMLLLLF